MIKILFLGAVLFSSKVQGKELQIQCPTRYPGEVMHLKEVPKGWDGQGRVSGSIPLHGASYVEGPVTGQSYGEMIGEGEVKTKDGFEARYFTNGQIKEKWILCRYGNDGNVELFHRVPSTITQCTIRTKLRKFPGDKDVRIRCT